MKEDQEHTARWWYYPPTQLTRPWMPYIMSASDEYGNPTILVVVPFSGGFVIRTGHRPFSTVEEY